MKIAVFHELHSGGARRAVNEFAKRLKRQHGVDLYIVDEKKNKDEEMFFDNIFFYKFVPKKWKGGDWKTRLYKDTIELYSIYRLHKKIARIINNKNYDIVLVNPSKFTQAPFILRFLGLKKIYFCMEPLRLVYDPILHIPKNLDVLRYSYEKINRVARKILDRQSVNHTQICIAPSKYLARLFSGIYNKPTEVIYCGVDTSFFKNHKTKRDIDILFVGSQNYLDGYPLFRDILKNIKTKIKVKELLSEKEWLSDTQLRDLYKRSKILVATSYNEPLGLVPLEAMACGVIVVAVDEAGYKETVVNGKTGYLVPRDPQKIAGKVEWLASHNRTALKLGRKGREVMVNNWTWGKRARELETLISNYLQRKGKPTF